MHIFSHNFKHLNVNSRTKLCDNALFSSNSFKFNSAIVNKDVYDNNNDTIEKLFYICYILLTNNPMKYKY